MIMALVSTPWAVAGASHSADLARNMVYNSNGGKQGISDPWSFKVRAATVPNGSVIVSPGSAVIVSTYAGYSKQSYSAYAVSDTAVEISPTGSAGPRSDLVVLRILDPEAEGLEVPDPEAFEYVRLEVVQGVSSTTTSAPVSYPHIVLARVTLPASTGTVTNGHITDLRAIALPKQHLAAWNFDFTSQSTVNTPVGTWTQLRTWQSNVPDFATRAYLRMFLNSMIVRNDSFQGEMRLVISVGGTTRVTGSRPFTVEPVSGSTGARFSISSADFVEDLGAVAGQRATFTLQVRKTYASSGTIEVHNGASISVDATYMEGIQ